MSVILLYLLFCVFIVCMFFFFKQKTAYEMRISDWSSDVCSSDLTPERFGKGAIEGVAGPVAANNAAAGGAFIPLLTLGIPPGVVTALLLGAFIIHGVEPGPLLMVNHPELFWGVIASMYIGNVMLLVLNLPLIGLWVQVLKVPYSILFPLILLFCMIGVYSVNGSVFDL